MKLMILLNCHYITRLEKNIYRFGQYILLTLNSFVTFALKITAQNHFVSATLKSCLCFSALRHMQASLFY